MGLRGAVGLALALVAGGCSHPPPNFAPDCPNGDNPTCSDDGSSFFTCGPHGVAIQHTCASDEKCDQGACKKVICAPQVTYCDRQVAHLCNATGTVDQVTDCEKTGETCVMGAMGAECQALVCAPGQVYCSSDGKKVLHCDPDGLGSEVQQACDDPDQRGNTCVNTVCVDRCTLVEASTRTSLGCHFLGALLEPGNAGGLLIYNPQPDLPAQVSAKIGGITSKLTVQPGTSGLMITGTLTDAGSVQGQFGMAVTSTVPVYAWQNGRSNGFGDGSMLLPEHTLGQRHVVPTWDNDVTATPLIAVVASAPGTQVTVTPTGPTLAGTNVPTGSPGVPMTATLQRGELLLLLADGSVLSGTQVTANAPVAVFTGARSPGDHGDPATVQAPVLPWAELGKSYSSTGAATVVVAREDNTHLVGPQGEMSTLNAGDSQVFVAAGLVTADRAFTALAMVNNGLFANGLAALVPDEQRLTSLVMPSPVGYFFTVVAGAQQITVDGAPQTANLAVGSGHWTLDLEPMENAVTVAGAPVAIYARAQSQTALTGPLGLDFVNP
jgi:hypothetical protein